MDFLVYKSGESMLSSAPPCEGARKIQNMFFGGRTQDGRSYWSVTFKNLKELLAFQQEIEQPITIHKTELFGKPRNIPAFALAIRPDGFEN